MNIQPFVKVHNHALEQICGEHTLRSMQDAKERRAALQQAMVDLGLKATPWAKAAGLSQGALPNFLAGRSQSLNQRSLELLAAKAEVPVALLTGELTGVERQQAIESASARRLTKDKPPLPDSAQYSLVAGRLKATRLALNLKASDLCRELGFADNQYSQWESGKARPYLDEMIRLSERYGVPLDWIYRGDPSGLPKRLADKILSGDALEKADAEAAPSPTPSPSDWIEALEGARASTKLARGGIEGATRPVQASGSRRAPKPAKR